jgi:hypothetical protein
VRIAISSILVSLLSTCSVIENEEVFVPSSQELILADNLVTALHELGTASNWQRTYDLDLLINSSDDGLDMDYLSAYIDTSSWSSAKIFVATHMKFFQALVDVKTNISYADDQNKLDILFHRVVDQRRQIQLGKYYLSCGGECLNNRENCRDQAAYEISGGLAACAVGSVAITSIEICTSSFNPYLCAGSYFVGMGWCSYWIIDEYFEDTDSCNLTYNFCMENC